ncbi:MAG: MucB/RseB C-terminal domain-containing protein [Cellvibrionaceae bacterium]|nr:MucB/RseB C-terminal domain-containing protein [Cellvibrionaceae bacterium]
MLSRIKHLRSIVVIFTAVVVGPQCFAAERESAEVLLARMAEASRSLNYSGTFTYEDGAGSVESLAITHKVQEGVEIERIAHLNGPPRVFSLPQKSSNCESVGSLLLKGDGAAFKPNPNYAYSVRGRNRVAGRIVDLLRVIPKDELRYGFTLGLDVETGLMLFAVVRSPKRILERVQFTSLNLQGGESSNAQLAKNTPCQELRVISRSPLAPTWVPDGFALAGYTYSEKTGHVETYTDGLVSFSVTVQTRLAESNEALQGEAQRGATVIKLALVAVENVPVQITIVGEIPPATANRILRLVRPSNKG